MLDHQLRSRKMANLDRIDWGEFKDYLNKNEQWLAKKYIPVYLSSLIAFSSNQLEALADAQGMTGTPSSSKRAATAAFTDPNDNNKRQRFEQWGAQVAASINGDSANPHVSTSACPFCGRHHSLAQCRGVLTSSLGTKKISLPIAVDSQSHHFIAAAPGGPRNLRSSVLVRAVVGATVHLTGATHLTSWGQWTSRQAQLVPLALVP
jgi:hypothetical protein